jgi:DNA-directed RNA polymerase specialized sigma24 family protein
MRQILVNHAKQHRATKRGRGNKVALKEGAAVVEQGGVDLIALDEALDKLAQLDPRQSRIVELTEVEIAEVLGVSAINVKRDWRIARAELHRQLGQASWRGRMSRDTGAVATRKGSRGGGVGTGRFGARRVSGSSLRGCGAR